MSRCVAIKLASFTNEMVKRITTLIEEIVVVFSFKCQKPKFAPPIKRS